MKIKSIPRIVFVTAIGVAGFTSGFLSGCAQRDSPADERLRTQIESEEWKKCDEVSPKTVYDAYFTGSEFADRLILAGRVSSILEELERSKTRFLNTGDLIEIFPVLYFYETQLALEAGLRPQIVNKIEYMKIIIAGYDAYKRNREAFDSGDMDAVDQRWLKYFQFAENAQPDGRGKWKLRDGVEALTEGINAHLASGVPRAIRIVLKESDVDQAGLKRDFQASDGFFLQAESKAKADILTLFDSSSAKEEANRIFGNSTEFVAIARKKAWEDGTVKSPFGSREPQSNFEHDSGSRKIFPKELMDRGICR